MAHTPGLWCHTNRPIQFTLVVDDFGIKYVGQEHADHLFLALKKHYKLAEDWDGGLYCGIKLEWNYQQKYLDISMPKYVPRVLQRYKHTAPSKPQHSPYQAQPKKYGTVAQDPLSQDDTTKLDDNCKKCIQQIVGAPLYYAQAVDLTILPALSSIASEQAEATKNTEKLDYMAMHLDATVHFHASQMILNIHSDASYLSEKGAKSCIAGQSF